MSAVTSAPPRALLTRQEAAEFLNLRPQTLAKWVSDGQFDLPIVRVGRLVRYKLSDLENFVARNTISGDSA